MELAMLAGLGAAGCYMNKNESLSEPQPKSILKPNRQAKVIPNEIPGGFDIYNQNYLTVAQQKQKALAGKKFNQSLNPTKTNVLPNYYNVLGPLMNKRKNVVLDDDIGIQYNIGEDMDEIYVDMPYMRTSVEPGTPNDIFKSESIDRDHLFLNDEYAKFNYKHRQKPIRLPGVARSPCSPNSPNNNPVIDKNSPRPPRAKGQTALEIIEKFQNIPDKNLLDISESLTDNADSIRRIMAEDATGKNKSQCNRKKTPTDRVLQKRLIGVTPDYKSYLVDDDTAKYPPYLGMDNASILTEHQEQPDYPAYIAQFDAQTFDCDGLPGAPNDVYQTRDKAKLSELERDLSFKEGWTPYHQMSSMSYGIVPDDELRHDNMVPFFKQKGGYGSNDLQNEHGMRFKNELFTGNLKDTWNKKQEVRPFFTPVADLSFIYGTPIRTEEEETRYIPSRYRNGERLFELERVTPGLNLDYNEIGTQGNFDMFRSLPKNVDELRIKPDQKITYEGRIIEGMKGQNRPVQAPVVSYRPDDFKITTEADLLPKTDFNTGPRTRDNFMMKETDRSEQNLEYTGGAYTKAEAIDRNVPEYMKPKVKYAHRQNFVLPKPLQKFAKSETKFNANLNSFDLPFNSRAQTCQNDYIGHTNAPTNTYANLGDDARTTIREVESTKPYPNSNVTSNVMWGTVHPMDVARSTIKEVTAEESLNPNAPSLNTQQKVYYSDVSRSTLRETTGPIAPSNAGQSNNMYVNPIDNARMTLKETTVGIPQNMNTTLVGQSQGAVHPQDQMKTTLKEDIIQIPYQTMITPINQEQGTVHLQDIARTTTREGTTQISQPTFMTPVNQQFGTVGLQDSMRMTMREGTVQTPWNTFVTPVNQEQGTVQLQDITRTTLREGLTEIPQETFITPVNQQFGNVGLQDIMRTTTREGMTELPRQSFITPVNQQFGNVGPQDIMRTTLREGMTELPQETFITPTNKFGNVGLQDIMRTTLREGIIELPQQNFITPVNQNFGNVGLQDITRTTLREGMTELPRQNFITPVNQNFGNVGLQDIMKTTLREGMTDLPRQNFITPVNQYFGQVQSQDLMRTTLKEGTTQSPHPTVLTAVGQQFGNVGLQDNAKTTTRETIKIPYNTHVLAVNQQHGQADSFNREPLRPTQKEDIIQIPYNTNVMGVCRQQGQATTFDRTPLETTMRDMSIDNKYIQGPTNDVNAKGYGYIAEKHQAPNTNKQFSCQEVYIPPVEGESKARPYDDAYHARVYDRREITQQYHEPAYRGPNVGPDVCQINAYLRSDDNKCQAPNPGVSVNNQLDRPMPTTFVSAPRLNVPENHFIDPNILKQLNDNPYNIPYYGTHYG